MGKKTKIAIPQAEITPLLDPFANISDENEQTMAIVTPSPFPMDTIMNSAQPVYGSGSDGDVTVPNSPVQPKEIKQKVFRSVLKSVKYKKNPKASFGKQSPHLIDNYITAKDRADPTYESSVRKGTYTTLEVEAVEQAVQEYMKSKDIPSTDLEQLITRRTKKDGNPYAAPDYNDFIGQVLGISGINRTKNSLSDFLRNHYDTKRERVGQTWTPEEDAQLLELVSIKGQKWAEINELMGRLGCKEHYRILARKCSGKSRGTWTTDEERLLLEALLASTRPDETEPSNVHWAAISAVVVTRDPAQCRQKFYRTLKPEFVKLHRERHGLGDVGIPTGAMTQEGFSGALGLDIAVMRINNELRVWTPEDDRKMLQAIFMNDDINDETDIVWRSLPAADIWGTSKLQSRFLYIKNKIPLPSENMTFIAYVQYCYEKHADVVEPVMKSAGRKGGFLKTSSHEIIEEEE
ncbi:Cyclin-D-binding Myb-like transcription factor 1 [Blyttiomyces sp. JEL0837]|nr:Cyclin-D-binding Myb-like transcription factor 1 [Blyttiomyces sp. JEL0837]